MCDRTYIASGSVTNVATIAAQDKVKMLKECVDVLEKQVRAAARSAGPGVHALQRPAGLFAGAQIDSIGMTIALTRSNCLAPPPIQSTYTP